MAKKVLRENSYKHQVSLTITSNTACASTACCVTPHARSTGLSRDLPDQQQSPWLNDTTWTTAMEVGNSEWNYEVQTKEFGTVHLLVSAPQCARKNMQLQMRINDDSRHAAPIG